MTTTRANTPHGTDGPPLPPPRTGRTAHRSPGRARLTGIALIALAAISALSCYVTFAAWLPADIKHYRDYVAARPCPAHPRPEVAHDCLRTVSFTVENTEVRGGRNGSYKATLSGAPAGNGEAVFGDPDPVLETLEPGDRITGTVWRGRVMTISKAGAEQTTSDAPRDEPQMTAALGTFLGLLAAMTLLFGTVRLTSPRSHAPFTWRPYGRPLFIAMAITCAAVGFLTLLLGLPWWLVPAVSAPAVGYTGWAFYRYRRQTEAAQAA
ncbi:MULTISPECIES: hypothetical protein [Streptomyces]|uniref:Uncharacterized protein n=2 Tax=Streptomyces rimosus subsp. rimosus TaxID=132474 RepID=A0A8A1UJF1_STRR1|nr:MULTISPECIES: hypothetical protein [Streptomyces]KUJ39292.1 hypothetical protein ADK46_13130 [Streptomyces rimosus subsp. rimosus]QDA08905.1 hypothetical protein CTZ40_39370 [Streptomyces rimosus]QEV80184.1 hypothetical protein CP984_39330 [Streptomyces rimosus]QST79052.1 hypothetical protein SRIM_001660 [Streptomyces rimosus subsp. rimosus ATCC 10970]QTL91050.1 hypothetical protein FMM49_39890 [Streptomyces rimosus subsp. rimosus]